MTEINTHMPEDFPKDVHQALRSWHDQQLKGPFDGLLLVQAMGSAGDLKIDQSLVTNEILMEGLDHVRRINPEAVVLLQARFLSKETAREVGHRLNVKEDVVFQRQRAAIEQLAETIWAKELELRRRRAQRIVSRLDPRSYTELFGVDDLRAVVRAKLEQIGLPWIISLEGIGGIGKTTLADAVVRDLSHILSFQDIAWISARQRLFQMTGQIKELSPPPALTPAELNDRIIEQFELLALKRQPDREKFMGVRSHLKSAPYLVVLDNLETVEDARALIPHLRELANPSKFLITSRTSVQGESGVHIEKLNGLSEEATIAMARNEAQVQGQDRLAAASDEVLRPIYEVTGGNPLAVKLIIGRTGIFPLQDILEQIASSAPGSAEELLNFIFDDAWSTLEPECQQVLGALLFTSQEGGRLEQIVDTTNMEANKVVSCLYLLSSLSLVFIIGDLNERRYALHPLTRNFLKGRLG